MSIKTENLYNKKPIEVAIIGYGTIGRVHGKILNKLGAKIVGVTCSTPDTVDKASTDIYHLGINLLHQQTVIILLKDVSLIVFLFVLHQNNI